jgi:hypothetical protein
MGVSIEAWCLGEGEGMWWAKAKARGCVVGKGVWWAKARACGGRRQTRGGKRGTNKG